MKKLFTAIFLILITYQFGYSQCPTNSSPIPQLRGRDSNGNIIENGCIDDASGKLRVTSDEYTTFMGGGSQNQGLTTYYGPADASPTADRGVAIVTHAGTVNGMYIRTNTATGAGESAISTLRKNGADTTMTCTISGASAKTCNDTTHTQSVSAGDELSIKVVTSSGAAQIVLSLSVNLKTT